ncbi:MAG: glutathione S-transferase family protein [Solirubrobacteraceae bacterium]|nr:glutathione S-transferase family protein [Solirubrobacteraceae bacterium]
MSTAKDAAPFKAEADDDGNFVRQQSAFRRFVSREPGAEFPPEAGRYHLYVSYACPWASRTLVVRKLKGLEDAIAVTIVDPVRDERGWRFGDGSAANGEPDPLHGWTYLSEGYALTDQGFDGRVTVPVLWDTKTNTAVNNESSEIIRMLNSEFDEFATHPEVDLYPEERRDAIDALNVRSCDTDDIGVYRSGFASTQSAYEENVVPLFESLEWLEELLSTKRYLTGDQITEADWRLAMTLFRFDPVYVGHFKCNIKRIVDLPNLWAYTRELYQHPGVAETVDFDHIKRHYYVTHPTINPTGVVPVGPEIDWNEPHGRG